jgi:hypothetical protein
MCTVRFSTGLLWPYLIKLARIPWNSWAFDSYEGRIAFQACPCDVMRTVGRSLLQGLKELPVLFFFIDLWKTAGHPGKKPQAPGEQQTPRVASASNQFSCHPLD